MANIRVKCPTCQTDLEIDAEFEGQEVECGNCLQVFVAQSSSSSSRSGSSSRRRSEDFDVDDDRPKKKKKKKKRELDWEDDYDDDDDYYDSPRGGGNNAVGIVSLVLGILSILVAITTVFCCCPFASAPFAIGAVITGVLGINNPDSKAMSIAGLVMGGLSLVFCVVMLFVAGFQVQNANQFR